MSKRPNTPAASDLPKEVLAKLAAQKQQRRENETPYVGARWLPERPPLNDTELARIEAFLRTVGVYPHPGQRDFIRHRAKNKILLCGRRWGKSFTVATEMLLHIMEIVALGWDHGRIMLTAQNYKQIRESMQYLERMLSKAGIPIRRVSTREERYYQAGPVKIELRPIANRKGLRGAGVTMLVVDECSLVPAELFFYDLLPSVSDHRGRVLIAGTPAGRNWVIEFAEQQGLHIPYEQLNNFHIIESPDKQTIIMRSPSWANPYLDKNEIEKQRLMMPDAAFRQEYGAEIVVEGLDPFPHKPIITQTPIPPEQLQYARFAVGIDYGFTEPSAIVLVAKLTNGQYYVVKCLYQAGIPADQLPLVTTQFIPNIRSLRTAADPSFWNRDGRHQIADYFAEAHIPLTPGSWDRIARWNMLRALLAAQQIIINASECTDLIYEFETAKSHKTKPDDIQKPDHALSALTYAIELLEHEQPTEPIPENSIYMMLKRREERLQTQQTKTTRKTPSRRW